jgi:hypothetical protein
MIVVGPAYGCSSNMGSSARRAVEAGADAEVVNALLCSCTLRSTRARQDLLIAANQLALSPSLLCSSREKEKDKERKPQTFIVAGFLQKEGLDPLNINDPELRGNRLRTTKRRGRLACL